MDKNTITGFALIAIVLIGFSFWNSKNQTEPLPEDNAPEQVTAATQKAATAGMAPVDSAFVTDSASCEETVYLQNEHIRVGISTKGGTIADVSLSDYKSYADFRAGNNAPLRLLTPEDAQLRFALGSLHLSDYCFSKSQQTDSTLTLTLAAADGRKVCLRYNLLPDNYLVNLDIRTERIGSGTLAIDWHDRLRQQEKGYQFESERSNITYKKHNSGTETLGERGAAQEKPETSLDWIAFKNQYFSSILIADGEFTDAKFACKPEEKGSGYLKDLTATMNAPLADGGTRLQFFFGPNQYRLLGSMNDFRLGERENDLQELVYLGWPVVRWINRFFTIYVFDFLTRLGLHMGLVLLIITLLLRIIVYAPTRKTFMSSAKQRVLKPKVDELAKKYPAKEDALKRQQEMMQLYRQYGVSPMGGCLPMLISMPIWIAMFNFVPNAIELRQQSLLWAEDLSAYDSFLTWNTPLPFIGNHLSLFCLLFCASNVLYSYMSMRQQRESMSAEQMEQMKMMQWMMYLMPVFFFFMFNEYSSGLNFYYFISLVASALTMWYLRRTTDDAKILAKLEAYYQEHKNDARKTTGLAARLEALQKQQQEIAERQKNLGKR
ncbi:MAG: membrane protein insertase YidC [Prevotellaceae bacterium]|nr:membrane protein insertase YidC [Prevotellaceae bacterium]